MKNILLSIFLIFSAGVSRADWISPSCNRIAGTSAVTFTSDQGRTLTPSARQLTGIAYTAGLVALDSPNTLVAASNGTFFLSRDAGCRWIPLSRGNDPVLKLTAAPGGIAYAWADNGSSLFRIAGRSITALPSPVSGIVGLGTDPQNGNHLRLGDSLGLILDSTDGGQTWRKIGVPPASGPLLIVYRIVFNPRNLNQIFAGLATDGAFVSTNGAASWTKSAGLSSSNGPVNVFNIAVSPGNRRIVWAMGLDIHEADQGHPSGGRHIYRSIDRGLAFSPVVDQTPSITLINGPLLAPHPGDSNILYFVFGTFFANYGTDLFRYDNRTGRVTKTHNSHDGISSIAFSPADPKLLYLGLDSEQGIF